MSVYTMDLKEVCHPRCVCETRRYVVKHNLITEVYLMNVMENNYMFRPVLAIIRLSMELKGLLYACARAWCRDLYIRIV